MSTVNGKKLNSRDGGLSFSILIVLYMVLTLILSLIIVSAGIEEGSDLYLYLSYLVSPVAIILTVLYYMLFRDASPRDFFPVRCRPKYYAVSVFLIFGLMFGLGWVNTLSTDFLGLFGYTSSRSYLPDLSSVGGIILSLIVIAVIPAICEECLFRGILLRGTGNGCGDTRAILLCGFCFSLYHGSPEQTIYQFICGCAFALLVVKSGSITPAVVIHFLNNALIIIFAACGLTDEEGNIVFFGGEGTAYTVTSVILLVAALICFVLAVIYLIRDRKEMRRREEGGVKTFFMYALVGIVIMAVIWIWGLVEGII